MYSINMYKLLLFVYLHNFNILVKKIYVMNIYNKLSITIFNMKQRIII